MKINHLLLLTSLTIWSGGCAVGPNYHAAECAGARALGRTIGRRRNQPRRFGRRLVEKFQ